MVSLSTACVGMDDTTNSRSCRRYLTPCDSARRVVGIPGDTITIRADETEPTLAHLYVNGVVVRESVVMHNKDVCGFGVETNPVFATWTVGEGEYFVLGDNRDHSYDSEDYGPIKAEWLMGEVGLARIGGKYKFDLSISMD